MKNIDLLLATYLYKQFIQTHVGPFLDTRQEGRGKKSLIGNNRKMKRDTLNLELKNVDSSPRSAITLL